MRRLSENGEPITPFKLQLSPDAAEMFTDAGGVVRYMAGAISSASTIRHAIDEAKILVALSQKRLFIQSCQQAATSASESDKDVSEHAASLGADIEGLLRSGSTTFEDDVMVTEKILQDLKSAKAPMSTGLLRLDNAMGGGLFTGKSYGFAARKKSGQDDSGRDDQLQPRPARHQAPVHLRRNVASGGTPAHACEAVRYLSLRLP